MPLPLIFSWEIYKFFRGNHRSCFVKKAALKNFEEIFRPATLFKKTLTQLFCSEYRPERVFPV